MIIVNINLNPAELLLSQGSSLLGTGCDRASGSSERRGDHLDSMGFSLIWSGCQMSAWGQATFLFRFWIGGWAGSSHGPLSALHS